MRSGAAVRHADAARIDDLPPVGLPHELHVRVPAHDGRNLGRYVGQHLGPALQAGVNEDDLLVVARRPVAEQDWPKPVEIARDRVRQPGQPADVIRAELACRPG